jgi:hypothetical protein
MARLNKKFYTGKIFEMGTILGRFICVSSYKFTQIVGSRFDFEGRLKKRF